MKEELKNIEGFPDYYVSDAGNFYSTRISCKHNPKGNLYKLTLWDKHPSGYFYAGMYNKPGIKNKRYFRAHRVVYETFMGPIPKGMEIDHINGNKKDNRLENLRLLTRSQNMIEMHKRKKNNN